MATVEATTQHIAASAFINYAEHIVALEYSQSLYRFYQI
jgi:hypothetical protein